MSQVLPLKSCCLLLLVPLLILIIAFKLRAGWEGLLELLQSVICHLMLVRTEYARQCNLYVRAL